MYKIIDIIFMGVENGSLCINFMSFVKTGSYTILYYRLKTIVCLGSKIFVFIK